MTEIDDLANGNLTWGAAALVVDEHARLRLAGVPLVHHHRLVPRVADGLALAAVAVEEGEHGGPVVILPASGRFLMVSRDRGAELRAAGAEVVDTTGMSYEEALRSVGLGPLGG